MTLKKDLGLLDVFCIAAGAMISSGLFVLPAIVFAEVGVWVIPCYLLAAVLMVPALLSKAELGTALPKSGGTYYIIDRSIGPAFGTLGGVAAWSSLSFKTAFALLGMGLFFQYYFPITDLETRLIAMGFCAFFMGLNLLGAKHAGRLQVVIVLALLAILVAYVGFGATRVEWAFYRPIKPFNVQAILIGAGMVFISFGGVTKLASVSEEIKNPGRNIALGSIMAFAVVSLLYVTVVAATVGLVGPEELGKTLKPIVAGGNVLFGRVGELVMSCAAMFAFITTANAGILTCSRVPMAMSKDGILPACFGAVNKRSGTPRFSIVCTSLFIMLTLLMPLGLFVKTASTLMILLFIFEMISLVLMRESGMESYRPVFRSPFYPWLHVFGIMAYMFLLVELGTGPLLIAVLILGGAFAWYAVFVQKHVVRESALTRLAQRIAGATFEDHNLEDELATIVRERDAAKEDDFDRLIRTCHVLDMLESMSRDELFHAAASWLGRDLSVPTERIQELLNEREDKASTIVRPGLAIPHVVLEGERLFDILLVRCRAGIVFCDDKPPVHTVFVLIGSRDVRQEHLRALMAIAEIAQDPEFEPRWLKAKGGQQLRNLVLKSKRRREVVLP